MRKPQESCTFPKQSEALYRALVEQHFTFLWIPGPNINTRTFLNVFQQEPSLDPQHPLKQLMWPLEFHVSLEEGSPHSCLVRLNTSSLSWLLLKYASPSRATKLGTSQRTLNPNCVAVKELHLTYRNMEIWQTTFPHRGNSQFNSLTEN